MERVSHRMHLTIVDNDKNIILHLCLRTVPEMYGHKGKVIVIYVFLLALLCRWKHFQELIIIRSWQSFSHNCINPSMFCLQFVQRTGNQILQQSNLILKAQRNILRL